MQLLNPNTIKLNQISLIEASAGTGKTYTMGSLYLRLLLREENPLSVEQILVVTFTKMATQELKQKIRERIFHAKKMLLAYEKCGEPISDEFLAAVIKGLNIKLAIERLTLAEQNMDLAAIYTIHGFCQRMLTQYAFHSGIQFNLELTSDEQEKELLLEGARQIWRQSFYSQPMSVAKFILKTLVSPDHIAENLKSYVSKGLKLSQNAPRLFTLPLEKLLEEIDEPQKRFEQQLVELKKAWVENFAEIERLIETEVTHKYKDKSEHKLKRASYKSNHRPDRYKEMNAWATSDDEALPKCCKYFSQQSLNKQAGENADPLVHPVFTLLDDYQHAQEEISPYSTALWHQMLTQLHRLIFNYKLNRKEKSFDDLLRLLRDALYQPHNEQFSTLIRHQYPFAMIDEFQDTDQMQYQIFEKIYVENPSSDCGFIMIGDPKQAIYKFRGADIFTYLDAADKAYDRFTLGKNYRSEQHLVAAVNTLFDFPQKPFLYEKIKFLPVEARADHARFYLNDQREPAVRFYIDPSEKENKQNLAQTCAISIQHWLQSAKQHRANFISNEGKKPLVANNIAVLVRNKSEAELIRKALQKLGIASVYLSDKTNVFDCTDARELAIVLTACLNPLNERNLLKAIATTIFGLTSFDIHRAKHDEQEWQHWVERFLNYQSLWQTQGVLPMLHQLFLQERITEKLLQQVGGERRVTDLLHLAELLQQASLLNESEAALLRWFEKQIQGENRQEEQQIRLESERQLVKVVTIHKSKGLEYDLVWLPFIGCSEKNRTSLINTYFDEKEGNILWDIDGQHKDVIQQEDYAEQLRLLYVALTRAKYQMAIALPSQFHEKNWNALCYLLQQGETGCGGETKALLDKIFVKSTALGEAFSDQMWAREDINVLQSLSPSPDLTSEQEILCAEEFTGRIERNWKVTSFSAIEQQHNLQQPRQMEQNIAQSAVDFGENLMMGRDLDSVELEPIENNRERENTDYSLGYTPMDLPRGVEIGTALHRYFEKFDFNQPVNPDNVARLCQWLQLDENWQQPLQQWLENILHTPLLNHEPHFVLAHLDKAQCVKEMQFYLKLHESFDVNQFNQALQKYHHLPSEPLQFEQIQGMVRGFIDLVFEHNGKYYLLDYKSNLLGVYAADYSAENLSSAMLKHHYDWQYLIYCVALNRYLQQRVANYDYERDFGGVIYCFLRGMNGQNPNGVFFDKPDLALIQALEEVF